jgi:hypothetical protein
MMELGVHTGERSALPPPRKGRRQHSHTLKKKYVLKMEPGQLNKMLLSLVFVATACAAAPTPFDIVAQHEKHFAELYNKADYAGVQKLYNP